LASGAAAPEPVDASKPPAVLALRLQQMLLERPRLIRVLILIAIAVVLEVALFSVGRVAPAIAGLMRPVYWVVGGLFAFAIGHASRQRATGDRRHSDRRS
jgi:hypothetical protein